MPPRSKGARASAFRTRRTWELIVRKFNPISFVLILAGLFIPFWPISLPVCWYLAYLVAD